eukprot:Amastigsp_a2781_11.p1 type:complete len:304 gc:universal Amastigsp_a2781_11:1-912(+)
MGASLTFVPLARTTLAFFDCTRLPNRQWVLDANLSQECFGRMWWRFFPIALIGVIVNVLALPIVGGFRLLSLRKQLTDDRVMFALHGLFMHLRRRYYYMELASIGKRLAIVFASLFFSNLQVLLLFALAVIIVSATVAQALLKPYYSAQLNTVELALDISALFVLLVGFFSYSGNYTNSASRVFMDVLLVSVVVVSLVFLVVVVVVDVMVYVRRRETASESPEFDPFVDRILLRSIEEAVLEVGVAEARRHAARAGIGSADAGPERSWLPSPPAVCHNEVGLGEQDSGSGVPLSELYPLAINA